MQLSVSDLKLYLQCPRAFKLHVIDGVKPQSTGLSCCRITAMQKIMAELHGKSEEAFSQIDEVCERVWQAETREASRQELDTVVVQEKLATKTKPAVPAITKGERILESIKTWCSEYFREESSGSVLYSNIHFQDTIGDITFQGKIDLVRKQDDRLQVVVFNTSSQPPNPASLEHDFALSLYAHAILWQGVLLPSYPDLGEQIRLETTPDLYVLYFPYFERYQKKNGNNSKGEQKGNPFIPVSRTREALLHFEYEVLYTVSGIESEFFPMMPGRPVGCGICPYAHQCNPTAVADTSFNVQDFQEDVA